MNVKHARTALSDALERELTQSDCARIIGISQGMWSKLEAGKPVSTSHERSLEMALKLAKLGELDIPASTL